MYITDSIIYLGVNDRSVDLFEGQYSVPNGISYNSYLIKDEKCAVMDTVDAHFAAQWLANLEQALAGSSPAYLVVQHMEPDHAGSIDAFARRYPETVIVSSAKAFPMMKGFFGTDYSERRLVVKEGDVLELGAHKLHFVAAPMVHWPEVIVTYESSSKVLFSADGFGKFGALDCDEPWLDEARRYFIGIVGKYGPQVQALLKKAAGLDIACICPLHGPVLKEELGTYLHCYDLWSSYAPEEKGVVIAYTSVYGHTQKAVELLQKELSKAGCTAPVVCFDLARCDMAAAVAAAYRYDRLVLATTTYNADIFPFMKTFIDHLVARNFQNRRLGLIENGSWVPMAAKCMARQLEKCKNLSFAPTVVTIRSALDEKSAAQIAALARELAE